MLLVPLAQVWTGLCDCSKCENIILDFTLIFNNENNSKFNIFCTLCPKISKSPSLNPTDERFSNNTKSSPEYPYKF
jgi:hypothetical protein